MFEKCCPRSLTPGQVFDGHGGREAAAFARHTLPGCVERRVLAALSAPEGVAGTSAGGDDEATFSQAVSEALVRRCAAPHAQPLLPQPKRLCFKPNRHPAGRRFS